MWAGGVTGSTNSVGNWAAILITTFLLRPSCMLTMNSGHGGSGFTL
jgi:hypothetical protein